MEVTSRKNVKNVKKHSFLENATFEDIKHFLFKMHKYIARLICQKILSSEVILFGIYMPNIRFPIKGGITIHHPQNLLEFIDPSGGGNWGGSALATLQQPNINPLGRGGWLGNCEKNTIFWGGIFFRVSQNFGEVEVDFFLGEILFLEILGSFFHVQPLEVWWSRPCRKRVRCEASSCESSTGYRRW